MMMMLSLSTWNDNSIHSTIRTLSLFIPWTARGTLVMQILNSQLSQNVICANSTTDIQRRFYETHSVGRSIAAVICEFPWWRILSFFLILSICLFTFRSLTYQFDEAKRYQYKITYKYT